MAVGQLAGMFNVLPPSRAGSLPQFFESCAGVVFAPKNLWEPSLLAIAVGQLAGMLNVSPSSRASFARSEEHTAELQSLMRPSYAVFCLTTTTSFTLSRYEVTTTIAHTLPDPQH